MSGVMMTAGHSVEKSVCVCVCYCDTVMVSEGCVSHDLKSALTRNPCEFFHFLLQIYFFSHAVDHFQAFYIRTAERLSP